MMMTSKVMPKRARNVRVSRSHVPREKGLPTVRKIRKRLSKRKKLQTLMRIAPKNQRQKQRQTSTNGERTVIQTVRKPKKQQRKKRRRPKRKRRKPNLPRRRGWDQPARQVLGARSRSEGSVVPLRSHEVAVVGEGLEVANATGPEVATDVVEEGQGPEAGEGEMQGGEEVVAAQGADVVAQRTIVVVVVVVAEVAAAAAEEVAEVVLVVVVTVVAGGVAGLVAVVAVVVLEGPDQAVDGETVVVPASETKAHQRCVAKVRLLQSGLAPRTAHQ